MGPTAGAGGEGNGLPPPAVCGNSVVEDEEACDDGDLDSSDGCSATCALEPGWDCDAEQPTACVEHCGDGERVGNEAEAGGCDDGNTTAGDGCGAKCGVEASYVCTGAPSTCAKTCGDGKVDPGETCDDANTNANDGCVSCAIGSGWNCSGTPTTCTDINECMTSNGGCDANATCANTTGSRTCTCKAGWSGSGTTCTDVNECTTSNGGCDTNATCANTAGSRTCTCKAGWSGNGTTCTDINECATSNGGCDANATCTNTAGSRTCACKAGFSGNGTTCTNVNDCASTPCQNGGSCVDGVNAYTCTCTNRYTGAKCEYLEVKLSQANYPSAGYSAVATGLSNDGTVMLVNFTHTTGDSGAGRVVSFGETNHLGFPPPYSEGSAFGIDEDGGTIAGSVVGESRNEAFKMVGTSTSVLSLDALWGASSWNTATAVSADGTTVVGKMSSGGGTGAFYCRAAQACREIVVTVASWIERPATGVNGDGTVVVGYTYPTDPNVGVGTAWRWVTSATSPTLLTVPSATWSLPRADGVSRNGQVVVGRANINGVSHAVRWSGASFTATDLGLGLARATNSDGSVTVGVDNANVPIVWLGTTRQTLASLLGTNPDLSGATLVDLVDVSDDGKVVAGTARVGGVDRAFMARLP
jgi:cysteine-rich repeat protein/probable HAF family extracellular repeat protein